MNADSQLAVRKVLAESADAEHFFDLLDAERLNWMIERAYELGKRQRHVKPNTRKGAKLRRSKAD